MGALSLNFSTFPPPVEYALESNVGVFTTDEQYIAGLSEVNGTDKTYMAAVSPWFFTHYSPETYDKNVSGVVAVGRRIFDSCASCLQVGVPRRLLVL